VTAVANGAAIDDLGENKNADAIRNKTSRRALISGRNPLQTSRRQTLTTKSIRPIQAVLGLLPLLNNSSTKAGERPS
jgi:hypothetical protein